jgi:hypothetical protein
MFNIPVNPQNQVFVAHPWDQDKCYGTQFVNFDIKTGAQAPASVPSMNSNASLGAEAIRNQPLRNIVAQRPQAPFYQVKNPTNQGANLPMNTVSSCATVPVQQQGGGCPYNTRCSCGASCRCGPGCQC